MTKRLLAILLLILFLNPFLPISKAAGVQNDSVQVNARVVGCELDLITYPEKRIPATNNWSTILRVQIYSSNNFVGEFTTTTDSTGRSLVNLCNMGIYLQPANYNFYLTGFSHLRKAFLNYNGFTKYSTIINFTSPRRDLVSGETSVVFDNYINSLDLSTQIFRLFSNDYKNDLNQDGRVNSLDISHTVINFYKKGD